ncbi:MAG: DUF1499 domain-containing protein [Pseudomonadota bacterium]
MMRLLGYGIALLAVLGVVAWIWINFMPIDPQRWHQDPATAKRSTAPNNIVYAPAGINAPDLEAAVFDDVPEALIARFAEIALAAPRVRELTTGAADYRTFVQRSALMGFPDYISVKAVAVEGGASLVVYSRSQYGYSDWGVNRKRVESWTSRL